MSGFHWLFSVDTDLGRTEGWVWLHTPVFSLLGRLKQGDLELENSLGYMKSCFRNSNQ